MKPNCGAYSFCYSWNISTGLFFVFPSSLGAATSHLSNTVTLTERLAVANAEVSVFRKLDREDYFSFWEMTWKIKYQKETFLLTSTCCSEAWIVVASNIVGLLEHVTWHYFSPGKSLVSDISIASTLPSGKLKSGMHLPADKGRGSPASSVSSRRF